MFRRLAPALVLALLVVAPTEAKTPDELDLNKKVTLNFEETRLQMVLAAIQESARVNLVVDPRVKVWTQTVSCSSSNAKVSEILDQIQGELGLERTVWCGTVYLYPKGMGPGAEPEARDGALGRQLATRVRTVNFDRTKLHEVIQRLKPKTEIEFSSLSFAVRKYLRSSPNGGTVTMKLWRPRLREVLTLVAGSVGLTWTINEKGKIAFLGKGAKGTGEEEIEDVGLDYDVRRGDKFDNRPKIDVGRLIRQMVKPATRETASRILVREGKAVAPMVASLLRDDMDQATVMAALGVLGEIGDPGEYAAVLKMFNNLDNPVKIRKRAGETLGQIKAGEAVPDLIDALNDVWFRISETARASLVAIGAPAIPALIERYKSEAEGDRGADGVVYRALLIFGEVGTLEAKRVLVKAVKETKGKRAIAIRHHAAIGLGLSADPRLVEPLILAFEKEKDFRVAKYISRSLTWLTDHEVVATRRDSWRIWWELEGRRKFKKRQTVDELLDDVAGGAVRLPKNKDGLAALETNNVRIVRLARELGADDPKVRRAAWRDLEGMDEKALPILRETAKSGNRRARANAKAIIARITAVPE